MSLGPRAMGYVRTPPRAWPMVEDSIEVWLTDQAWILRRETGSQTDDGTPVVSEVVFGPYKALLSRASAPERTEPDRQALEIGQTLTIASDEKPLERDRIRVLQAATNELAVWEIKGTVNWRPAAWGNVGVWNVEVERVEEY